MTDLLNKYWLQLQPRERMVLGWGGALVVLILFYSFVWQPWQQAISHMETAIQPRRASLVWMQQQAELVQNGSFDDQAQNLIGGNQSLLSVIEQTAKTFKVSKAIQQMVPNSEGQEVRVVLEEVDFNQWVKWIDSLYKNYGVGILQMSAERDEDSPNIAEIRITFER